MFQPQPTPYSPFTPYGLTSPIPEFPGFQPAAGVVVVDSSGPTVFRDPIFSPVASNNINAGGALSFNNHNNSQAAPRLKMASNDMEAQEALARDFQPALEGPLVGEKKSSLAITEEYARADPVYVAKTSALPQKYSHYRPVLGDGNCGWRAAGFSYFETLLRLQNKAQLEEEIARMTSLDNLLKTAGGFAEWVYEDMAEEVTSLLRELADLLPQSVPQAEATLRARFNDPNISNSIVYYFRLLASSWLKANAASYEGFIPDGLGVDGYTKNWIEPVNQEIDHLGMTLLIDALLKPVGFAVEIVYLDRSEGSQANSHVFQSEDSNGVPTNPAGPMIHLLYRPSHYDILYKDQGSPISIPQNTNIQVRRAINISHRHSIQNTPAVLGDMSGFDLFSCIPGFSLQPSHHGFPSQYQTTPLEQAYTPSSMSASMSPISPGASSVTPPSNALPATFPAQPPPPTSLTPPTLNTAHPFPPPTTQLPILTHLPAPHRSSISSHTSLSGHPLSSELSSPSSASSFRPSKYEWEAAAEWEGPVVFQTSTFKNSHYNVAHYNNPNFQPEEWTPESEDPPTGRKRSS
ncbi:hypothetical protein EG329_006398 [Mollisiaceae sp. DMI_Dod_QoI]|nr:hypothetical protein EG329_006398 [Helotiales sp. DMI_Dod_QoI]